MCAFSYSHKKDYTNEPLCVPALCVDAVGSHTPATIDCL